MLCNYHMHTNHTVDAVATVKEYSEKAREKGFDEICITNHHEFGRALAGDYDFALTDEQWSSLKAEMAIANKSYAPLKIRLGVEIDYQAEHAASVAGFLRSHPFDYVISSIHFVDGIVVADIGKLIPSNVDVKAFYRHYFALIKEMIAVQDFDCVGHLDVLRRAAPAIPFIDYERDIDDIASLLLKHDKGFEVNTSGFRYGNGGPYPCFDIIKRLYDRGVRKVTIGSDCHAVDDFDAGLAEGIAMLKKAGYSQICTFEKRKARFMDI